MVDSLRDRCIVGACSLAWRNVFRTTSTHIGSDGSFTMSLVMPVFCKLGGAAKLDLKAKSLEPTLSQNGYGEVFVVIVYAVCLAKFYGASPHKLPHK